MQMSQQARHRARYLVPIAAAAVAAGVVFVPQAASGAQHPTLPARTAAQLLASLEQAEPPQFSGTTVETARLGLPSLDDVNVGGVSTGDGSPLSEAVTLLTGSHTAQIAYGGADKQRVAIFLSDLSETDIVHNGTNVWTYSSDNNSVSHSTLKPDKENQAPDSTESADPTKAAEHALKEIDPSTKVTVDRTAEVAGRPAYQLVLTPRDSRTLIGSVRIAVDSKTSLPLRVEVWARRNPSQPAFSVGFTSISMTPPNASTFDFTKPPTAHDQASPFSDSGLSGLGVTAGQSQSQSQSQSRSDKSDKDTTIGKDWTTVFVETVKAHTSVSGSLASNGPRPVLKTCSSQTGTCTTTEAQTGQVPPAPDLAQTLRQLGTHVAGGTLITTTLASILITNDNRVLIGAVTPAYLEQVAAGTAGK